LDIEVEFLSHQALFFRLDYFLYVVSRNLRVHSDRDSLRSREQDEWKLRAEDRRLLASAVVARDVVRDVRVVEEVLRQRIHPALYVSRRGRSVSSVDVPEISLLLYEVVPVREHNERASNRSVSVRMVLHASSHHGRDFLEPAVVHFEERVHDAPLHRLEPVLDVWNRPVTNDVARVFNEVFVE